MSRKHFNPWGRATENSHDAAAEKARIEAPAPTMFVVLGPRGVVLHETADSHRAFRLLCSDPRARAKANAADHKIVYAHRRSSAIDRENLALAVADSEAAE